MIKFIKITDLENRHDRVVVEHTVEDNDVSWPDLLEDFFHFLRGCGYQVGHDAFMEEAADLAATPIEDQDLCDAMDCDEENEPSV